MNARTKRQPVKAREIQVEGITAQVAGRQTLVSVPIIPADAGPVLREGLRRRRVAAVLGWCPCGARRSAELADKAGKTWVPVPHAMTCQAHDDQLGEQITAWQQQDGGPRGTETR